MEAIKSSVLGKNDTEQSVENLISSFKVVVLDTLGAFSQRFRQSVI